MRVRERLSVRFATALATICALSLAATSATAQQQQDGRSRYEVVCARNCLVGFAEQFLAALAARQPSLAPLAPEARYTENGVHVAIGDALWATGSGIGENRLIFTDPATGGIALYTGIYENGLPSMLAARLKVENREITEIETSLLRRDEGDPAMETFALERPIWLREVPAEQRVSRQALIDIADSYFEGITQGRGDITPFHDDCIRFENGGQMTGRTDERAGAIQRMGCQAQFETGMLVIVTSVSNRRYLVVDEENQVVFAIANFDHRGTVDTVEMRNGETYTASSAFRRPFSFQIFEAFKIVDGRIRQIEATVLRVPYRMRPDWPMDEAGG